MKTWILLSATLVFAVGCNDRDRTDVELNAAVAWTSAREAVSTAWSSMSKEAAKITADASKSTLEAVRRQAESAQDRLSKMDLKNPFEVAQMDVAKGQIEKVDAAMTLQDLQEQSKLAVQKAIESGRLVQQNYEEASKRLAEMDATYRSLQDKLVVAQGTYEQASNVLRSALDRASELVNSKK